MKTVYTAIMERLKTRVPALKWIDLDTGQLETGSGEIDRPAVAFPCALVTIGVTRSSDITDLIQDCEASIVIRIAFDQQMRTNAAAPAQAINAGLTPYAIIADVYSALQGYGTVNFDPLSRISQGKENGMNGLFIYRIEFRTTFEDQTASL